MNELGMSRLVIEERMITMNLQNVYKNIQKQHRNMQIGNNEERKDRKQKKSLQNTFLASIGNCYR